MSDGFSTRFTRRTGGGGQSTRRSAPTSCPVTPHRPARAPAPLTARPRTRAPSCHQKLLPHEPAAWGPAHRDVTSGEAVVTRRSGSCRGVAEQFPHPDVQESPFTTVSKSTKGDCMTMHENNFSPSKLNDRLPLLFKVHEKNLLQGKFPFSAHDNKYCLRHTGEHLTLGLGQKKVSVAKQTAHTIELWDPGKASAMNSGFGITIYQTSYQGNQDTERPNYRRYPKIPSESSQRAWSRSPADLMWFGKNNSLYRIPLEVLGITQRPLLSSDKKFYRTRILPK